MHTSSGANGLYLYTTDLLCLEHSLFDRSSDVNPMSYHFILPLNCPPGSNVYYHTLIKILKANYILNGIERGFSIGKDTLYPL